MVTQSLMGPRYWWHPHNELWVTAWGHPKVTLSCNRWRCHPHNEVTGTLDWDGSQCHLPQGTAEGTWGHQARRGR